MLLQLNPMTISTAGLTVHRNISVQQDRQDALFVFSLL
jgi:hypothetical protein